MTFSVRITRRARADIISLHEYISQETSAFCADSVVEGLLDHCDRLSEFPEKGHFPPELEGHQRTDLREIRFKPYRILYRIDSSRIDVLAIFDGRRDARALIEQRMWRG